jgi:hypothetical protein
MYAYARQQRSEHHLSGEYDELTLLACLKFARYLFTEQEQQAILTWIDNQFDLEQASYLPERFAAYVVNFDAAYLISDEEILVADGKDFEGDRLDGWEQINSITRIDFLGYNERYLKRAERLELHSTPILLAGFQKRFIQARKRLCARELFEQLLAVSGLELPVFLNLDLMRLTIDCVGTGVLSDFEAMQIIGRVARSQRNARMRAQREAGQRRTRSMTASQSTKK